LILDYMASTKGDISHGLHARNLFPNMSSLPFFRADCRCLVTGSTDPGSIGYACAVALLQAGVSSVTLSGRNAEKLSAAVALLKEQSSNVYGVLADLKEPDQMAPAIEEASSLMDGLDVLVISGGNGGSEYLGLSTKDPNAFRLLHTMAVISPMLLTHAAIAKGATSIVMVTSMAARVAWPDTAPYNTAKGRRMPWSSNWPFSTATRCASMPSYRPAFIPSSWMSWRKRKTFHWRNMRRCGRRRRPSVETEPMKKWRGRWSFWRPTITAPLPRASCCLWMGPWVSRVGGTSPSCWPNIRACERCLLLARINNDEELSNAMSLFGINSQSTK
jgi:short chain dehydrogenase